MAAVAAIFATVALSAQPNQHSSNKKAPAPEKNPPVVLTAPNYQYNCQTDATKPSANPPPSHAPLHDPNWVLVIVGSVTCCVVGWQSWEMRRQNRYMVAKERARIAVNSLPDPMELDDGPEWIEGLGVVWAGSKILVANVGSTNAFNVMGKAEIVGTPSGGTLGSEETSILNLPTVLKPNTDPISVDIVTLLKGKNHVSAVKNRSEILHLIGTITYNDIFGKSRKTQFRYVWEIGGLDVDGKYFETSKWQRTAEGNRAN